LLLDKPPPAERFDKCAVYLGHYSGHYGHFLLETLSRFWPLGRLAFNAVIAHPFIHTTPPPSTFEPAAVSFRSFRIDPGRLRIVDRPLRVERLLVPSSLFDINYRAHEDLIHVYRRIAEHCTRWRRRRSSDLRVYLSRSRFRSHQSEVRSIANEVEIEAVFQQAGFHVVHPQLLGFADQVRLYARASVLAGLSGSALHNSVFTKPGTRVITIGTARDSDQLPANQRICDSLACAESAFLPFVGTIIDKDSCTGVFDIDALQEALRTLLGTGSLAV
jgi:capsular polysaccharide biosynthesis protein